MALWRGQVTSNNIEDFINQFLLDHHEELKSVLDIQDMQYEIKMEKVKVIKEDFIDDSTEASCVPDRNTDILTEKVPFVVFFTEVLCVGINRYFAYYSEQEFYKLAEVYVKYVIIHELVHIKQVKNGMTFDDYFSLEYPNKYEDEAIAVAIDLLGRIIREDVSLMDSFSRELQKILKKQNNHQNDYGDYWRRSL